MIKRSAMRPSAEDLAPGCTPFPQVRGSGYSSSSAPSFVFFYYQWDELRDEGDHFTHIAKRGSLTALHMLHAPTPAHPLF
jgi:hypothetical protein